MLPDQNRVLVVRKISKDPALPVDVKEDPLVVELFEIPQPDKTLLATPTAAMMLPFRRYLNVQISELQRTVQSGDDDSITPDFHLHRKPQPLSIYLRTEKGMAHHSLWPIEQRVAGDSTKTVFDYDPEHCKHILFGDERDDTLDEDMDVSDDEMDENDDEKRPRLSQRRDYAMRFIPGAHRAFVYAIPRNYRSTEPPIMACWGFQYNRQDRTIFLGDQDDQDGADVIEEIPQSPISTARSLPDEPDALDHPGLDIPPSSMERTTILGPIKLPEDLRAKLAQGVSGISFDEDSGRLAFATKKDNRLHVVDFARIRPRGTSPKHKPRDIGIINTSTVDADDIKHNEIMDEELRRGNIAQGFLEPY